MEQVGPQALHRKWQGYLLPQRIAGAFHFYDGKVGRLFQTAVLAWSNENVVFVAVVTLLQLPDRFQGDEVHAMLVGTEYALGFNGDFHTLLFIVCFLSS